MKKVKLGLLLLIASLIFTSCSFSFSASTAKVKDAVMTTGLDKDGKNIDKVTSYKPDSEAFFVVATVTNAPDNTKIKFKWVFVSENIDIDSVELSMSGSHYVNSNLSRGNNPWPTGDYEVQIYLNDGKEPAVKVPFKVIE